jgi:hypothetical protein
MTDKSRISLAVCLLIFGLSSFSQAQELPPEIVSYADMVLYNGQVLTMDREQPPINVVQAVALREGRILAVGEDDPILRMAGPDTTRVNLRGRSVIPGVIDTHSHPNSYALRHYADEYDPALLKAFEANNVRFARVRWETKETALADFALVAKSLSPGEMIYTSSRSNPVVREEMNRYNLDEVVPDNPVYIRIGNAMWGVANSKMLEIIEETYGGTLPGISRDEQGVPTGQIFGAGGTTIDQELIPQTPPEVLAPFFKKELEEWVAIGVTTLSTRLMGNEISAYAQLDGQNELPLRLAYSHEMGRNNPFLERLLKRFGNLQGHGTDRMWMIGISVGIPDGNGPGYGRDGLASPASGESSCVSVPKREILPNDYFPDGVCFWELPGTPGADSVVVANRYGYRVTGVHTFGDKAFLMMLDAYEQAGQESSIQGNALDHGIMVSPEVIKRSAEQGMIWSLQPPLFYGSYTMGVSRMYGEEYAHKWVLPVKSLIDAGVKVTYGADTHTDPEREPMFNLETLVTRRTYDGRVFGSAEAIDRSNGLLMMTRWGAEYVIREKELGSIETGKLADLVVLDKNPLDRNVPDEDLSEIKVVATIIGGELAYGTLD